MKKLLAFLFLCSLPLLADAQEGKEIPFAQLSFTNCMFNEQHHEVTFKGGKWNSFIKLPVFVNNELPHYKRLVIDIPRSSVMLRIKFIGKDDLCRIFYQPPVRNRIKREINLALVPFRDKVQEIRIEAQQGTDEAGNYHTLSIQSIHLQ